MYLLSPVIASEAAGPEMKSTWFWAAIGASWSATPDDVAPAMIVSPWPIRVFICDTPVAGSVASSAKVRLIFLPFTMPVPLVAYWMPYLRPSTYSAPYADEEPGARVDDADVVTR